VKEKSMMSKFMASLSSQNVGKGRVDVADAGGELLEPKCR
jgi:hypothetical protein